MPAGLPTSITVAVEFTAGVWTSLTDVQGDSIEIRVGRESASSDVQPGTLTFALDNIDGTYTPDNPTSSLYPNWVEGKRVRVQVVVGGTTYTRFVGRITAIEPDFPTVPWSGTVVVSAVDLLGDLQQVKLRQAMRQAAFLDAADYYYYPLDDTNPKLAARELKKGGPDLVPTGGVDFGSDDSFGVDDIAATAFSSDGSLVGVNRSGTWNTSATQGGVYCFVKVTSGVAFDVVSTRSNKSDRTSGGFHIRWSGTQFVYVSAQDSTGFSNSTSITPSRDGWHLVGIRAVSPGGTDAFLDGTFTNFTSNVYALTQDCPALVVGGLGSGVVRDVWAGYTIAPIGITRTYQSTFGGGLSFASALTTFGELVPLTTLGATVATSAGAATQTVSAFVTGDRSAFDVLLDVAEVESGVLYHEYSTSATQTIRIVTLADYAPTSASLTVDAAGDMVGGPTLSRSNVDTVVTITAESPTQSVTVTDTAQTSSGSSEGLSSFRDTFDALRAQAEGRLAASRERHLRVSQLTVDLSTAANNLYASFFALYPSRRVRLSNLPSTYFGVTYMDGYVEGWTERPGVTGYEVTFDLSPADAPPEGLWDDSTYGRWGFGDGVATNSSSATSGATSVQFQWTGGLTLSTSAGDYPLDLDWNGERVTVTAAPAGGSSPQTLTITRGVAPTVARAHNAGEPVDIWNAARWAM